MPRLQVDIPDDDYSDFKKAVNKGGQKINFVVLELIRRFTREKKQETGQ